MTYEDCTSNQPCKAREVIPDVQENLRSSLLKTDMIWKQIDRLIYALDGPQPTSPECGETKPLDRQHGSLETLESTAKELRSELIDIEDTLRAKITLLLGMKK